MGRRIKHQGERRAVDKERNNMEKEVFNNLEEDSGSKMIYKLPRDRDEDVKDMKRGR